MNNRSVKKKRSIKASRSAKASRSTAVRKAPPRKRVARKDRSRQPARSPEPVNTVQIAAVASVTVAQVTAIASGLGTHKFRVGQTVLCFWQYICHVAKEFALLHQDVCHQNATSQ